MKIFLKKGNAGVSLIEVLLAIAILGTGIVGVLGGYVTAIDSLTVGKSYMDFIFLAKEKMGEIEEIALVSKGILPKESEGNFSGSFSEYTWHIEGDLVAANKLNELSLLVSKEENIRGFSVSTYFNLPGE